MNMNFININWHFSSSSRQFTTRTRISSCLVLCWTPPWLTKSKLRLLVSSSINLPPGWPTSQSVSRCLWAMLATHWTANCRTWLVRTRKVRREGGSDYWRVLTCWNISDEETLKATWHSTTPPIKPLSHDRLYYFLPIWDDKVTLYWSDQVLRPVRPARAINSNNNNNITPL